MFHYQVIFIFGVQVPVCLNFPGRTGGAGSVLVGSLTAEPSGCCSSLFVAKLFLPSAQNANLCCKKECSHYHQHWIVLPASHHFLAESLAQEDCSLPWPGMCGAICSWIWQLGIASLALPDSLRGIHSPLLSFHAVHFATIVPTLQNTPIRENWPIPRNNLPWPQFHRWWWNFCYYEEELGPLWKFDQKVRKPPADPWAVYFWSFCGLSPHYP